MYLLFTRKGTFLMTSHNLTTIFDNSDVDLYYDTAKEFLIEEGWDEDDIPDDVIWDEVGDEEARAWDDAVKYGLIPFLKGKTVLMTGKVQRWDGTCAGGRIGAFEDLFYAFTKDCDYVRITDEDGRLYIEAMHHDGTDSMEVRILTPHAKALYDDWEYDEGPFHALSERQLHSLFHDDSAYSKPPYVARDLFGITNTPAA